jgi:hypothetical protein
MVSIIFSPYLSDCIEIYHTVRQSQVPHTQIFKPIVQTLYLIPRKQNCLRLLEPL